MNEVLMRAVVESLAFAELTVEELLDLHAAVTHEESLAAILLELSPSERTEFCASVQKMADDEEKQTGPTQRTKFMRSIPVAIGLVE